MRPIIEMSQDSGTYTLPQPELTSTKQAQRGRPKVPLTASGIVQEKSVKSSIAETATAANEGTSAHHAVNQAMEQTSVESETRSERGLAEPSASHLRVTPFWKAAAKFVDLNEEGEREERMSLDSRAMEEVESNLPRFMRGFGFRDNATPRGSRTAEFTLRDDPLPQPLPIEFEGPAWVTICYDRLSKPLFSLSYLAQRSMSVYYFI